MHADVVSVDLTKGRVAFIDAADWLAPVAIRSAHGTRVCRLCDMSWHYEAGGVRPSGRTTGYARGSVRISGNRVNVRMHRLVMRADSGQIVDHLNGNGLDNRRCNLEFVSNSENIRRGYAAKRMKSA